MPSKLQEIVDASRCQVAEAKSQVNLGALQQRAAAHTPRGFREALSRSPGPAALLMWLSRCSGSVPYLATSRSHRYSATC